MSRADKHEALDEAAHARWMKFARPGTTLFVHLVGLEIEDVRADYCRMRLPFRPELRQGGGVMHGGAIVTLLDSVMVPAVGSVLERGTQFSTVDLHVQFIGAARDDDVVAEGWVTRRGRTVVFGESEARGVDSGRLIGKAALTFNVAPG
ncbi:MAG: PaaI family thioesterase [Actinomycetota bacterium]|nr:PaaI family thioesterase [Actinomycetota bacterium]